MKSILIKLECKTYGEMFRIRDKIHDKLVGNFDYTDDKSVFNNKINRIKRKVLKTDK